MGRLTSRPFFFARELGFRPILWIPDAIQSDEDEREDNGEDVVNEYERSK